MYWEPNFSPREERCVLLPTGVVLSPGSLVLEGDFEQVFEGGHVDTERKGTSEDRKDQVQVPRGNCSAG